jgi:cyclophilin family peptidyl-prolyl cis-trans isomerase
MKKIIITLSCLSMAYCNFAQSKKVKMETTMGTIVLELYDGTPKHQANFLKLANERTLDSTLFHRVIKGFMIQGGDVSSKKAAPGVQLGGGDLGYRVDAEFMPEKYFHKKGALCAARDGNPAKASSSCQFYIVHGKLTSQAELESMKSRGKIVSDSAMLAYTTIGGTPFLDGEYTVFGQVLEGMEIVEKIASTATAPGDRPIEDVRILSVREIGNTPIKKKRKKFLGIF